GSTSTPNASPSPARAAASRRSSRPDVAITEQTFRASQTHRSLQMAPLATVEEEDDKNRAAVDDAAPPVGHVLGEQHADERDERDRAREGAEVVASAAEDRDAADHRRGDRLEEVRVAHAERRLPAVGDEDDAPERGEE